MSVWRYAKARFPSEITHDNCLAIALLCIFGNRKNWESNLLLECVLFSLNWRTFQTKAAFSLWGDYQDRQRVIATNTTQSMGEALTKDSEIFLTLTRSCRYPGVMQTCCIHPVGWKKIQINKNQWAINCWSIWQALHCKNDISFNLTS